MENQQMNLAGRLAYIIATIWLLPVRLLGGKFHSLVSSMMLSRAIHTVAVGTDKIRFFCPNMLTYWRAETLLDKEPETIEWLDTLQDDDILWDIGANVGLYSLYAGIIKKAQVMAFEPSAANYFTLSRNIELNKCDDRISAFCLAFNDKTKLDKLNMENTEIGGAMSSFASTKDLFGNQFTAAFKQGMVGLSIDNFIQYFNPPIPSHLKIDVDGIEGEIIDGARQLINNSSLKSISIELDDHRKDEIIFVTEIIEGAGFQLKHKRHAPLFDGGKYASCYNYLFVRK
jgi:FkbM family methyltransferase